MDISIKLSIFAVFFSEKLKLKFNLYFIKFNLIKIKIYLYFIRFNLI